MKKLSLIAALVMSIAGVFLLRAQTDYYDTSPHGDNASGVLRDDRFPRGDCNQCHIAHEEITPQKLLLFQENNNSLCYFCHSQKPTGYPAQEDDRMPINSTYPGYFEYNSGGVKIKGIENRKRWPGQLVYENLGLTAEGKFYSPHRSDPDMPRRDNNGAGMCVNCHNPHGTRNAFDMLDTTYLNIQGAFVSTAPGNYALCFKCHSSGGPSGGQDPENKRIADYYDKSINNDEQAGHQFQSSYGYVRKGDQLPCYDCHNPHGSAGNDGLRPNAYLLSDQRAGWSGLDSIKTSSSQARRFCFGCHRSSDGQGGGTVEGVTLSPLPGDVQEHSFNDPAHCYDCHGRDYSSITSNNIHHPTAGGDCLSCHSIVQGSGPTTRRVITGPSGDFSKLAHHVTDGTRTEVITKFDCGVCHMEGDAATGKTNSLYHRNQVIDLRNPDTGGAITGLAKFTRDTLSNNLESWVTNVQNNLCLKCHDADGASSPLARTQFGSPQRPFSAQTKDAPDVNRLLSSSNGFQHAVLFPGNNPYCTPTSTNGNVATMNQPWNQTLNSHNKISCFDCHAVNGHGGNYSGLLRRETYYKDPVVNPNFANAQRDFCGICHKLSSYYYSSNGSRLENHDERRHRTVADGGRNKYGCRGCHAGIYDDDGNLTCENGSALNTIHGGSFTWPVCSKSSGSDSKRFLVGGYLSGWQDGTKDNATCWGGSCHHSNGTDY